MVPASLRSVPSWTAGLLAVVAASAFANAQGDVVDANSDKAAAALVERLDRTIDEYEKVRKDKDKLAQRRRLIGWIGEIDHPRATDYLRGELKANARRGFGWWVIAGIRKVPRPELEDDLLDVLRGGKTARTVRVAAATAVIALGKRPAERIVEMAAELDAKVVPAAARFAAVEALATSDDILLHREAAKLIDEGDNPNRLQMLVSTERGEGSVFDNARIRCVKEGDLIVSATAWRMLAENGHSRARELTIDVLERIFDAVPPAAAAELVRGLALSTDRDFYPALLRFGAVRGWQVKAALKRAAKSAADNHGLLEWLVENGIESENAAERQAAKTLLQHAPKDVIRPLVERVRADLMRNRKRVLDTAAGLHELLAKDPAWEQDLATLASATDLESRLIGLSLLLEMGSRAAIPAAQRYLSHSAWELRSLAMRYLSKARDVTTVPLLIRRYGREEGRLAHELDHALFVHTGTRCWSGGEWRDWWKQHETGFVLPHENSVQNMGGDGGNTASYYGIPLISTNIAFVVDKSGSMAARVGTDDKRTRLTVAQEQLRKAAEALPKTHELNLVPFSGDVESLWRKARKLSGENRKEFLEGVANLRAGGGTNTFGGLMMAFGSPNIDTVYLLTDGQPTAGELIDADDILDAVLYENRTRQLVIHCISIGVESKLLKDLAALTGGEYKFVK